MKAFALPGAVLASLLASACGTDGGPCRKDWHVGQTVEYTVVQPFPSNGPCNDALGLGEGATFTTTIREFKGGSSCLVAVGDVTTSTGTWTVTSPLGDLA